MTRKRATRKPKNLGSGVREQLDPHAPQHESGVLPSAPKPRRHQRFLVTLPVRIAPRSVGEAGALLVAQCDNLSLGGMYVRCDVAMSPGEELRVWLTLPDGRELMVAGTVRWTSAVGMGIEHELLDASDTHALSGYLASLA